MIDIDLQVELSIKTDPEFGPYILLNSFDHAEYIDDLLNKVFDFSIWCMFEDKKTGIWTYYLGLDVEFEKLSKIVQSINEYHKRNNKIYSFIEPWPE